MYHSKHFIFQCHVFTLEIPLSILSNPSDIPIFQFLFRVYSILLSSKCSTVHFCKLFNFFQWFKKCYHQMKIIAIIQGQRFLKTFCLWIMITDVHQKKLYFFIYPMVVSILIPTFLFSWNLRSLYSIICKSLI